MRGWSIAASGWPLALALWSGFVLPASAQDAAESASAAAPCNAVCGWWMSIGRKAEPEPPPARPAVEAVVPTLRSSPPPAALAAGSVQNRRLLAPSNLERAARRSPRGSWEPLRAALSRTDEIATPPTRGLWNAPICGSATVLASAAFVRP